MSKSIRFSFKNREGTDGYYCFAFDYPIYRISGILLNMELKGGETIARELFEAI
jgi:hypothetical protein